MLVYTYLHGSCISTSSTSSLGFPPSGPRIFKPTTEYLYIGYNRCDMITRRIQGSGVSDISAWLSWVRNRIGLFENLEKSRGCKSPHASHLNISIHVQSPFHEVVLQLRLPIGVLLPLLALLVLLQTTTGVGVCRHLCASWLNQPI